MGWQVRLVGGGTRLASLWAEDSLMKWVGLDCARESLMGLIVTGDIQMTDTPTDRQTDDCARVFAHTGHVLCLTFLCTVLVVCADNNTLVIYGVSGKSEEGYGVISSHLYCCCAVG